MLPVARLFNSFASTLLLCLGTKPLKNGVNIALQSTPPGPPHTRYRPDCSALASDSCAPVRSVLVLKLDTVMLPPSSPSSYPSV
eukprot:g41587.t1